MMLRVYARNLMIRLSDGWAASAKLREAGEFDKILLAYGGTGSEGKISSVVTIMAGCSGSAEGSLDGSGTAQRMLMVSSSVREPQQVVIRVLQLSNPELSQQQNHGSRIYAATMVGSGFW
ncbi:hypothetical protein NE237_021330 [Protea cynaroides]|uniref:Uncharacterized protein n=1 Tax=Protea cynaroides TaxID=273540 RepID=A0A9Q0HB39_9MAGN|nr:hypothetical protein NE237_021330 [Protea cynaroides]